jgi:hypothetical protein
VSSFSLNKMRRAIGHWYCPYFRIDRSVFMPEAYGFFSIRLVLTIDPIEGNFLPHTRYEGIVDTIVQLFCFLTSGLIAAVTDAR